MARAKKNRPSLEEMLQHVQWRGTPKSVVELGIRLKIEEAEELCALLAMEGIDVEPYDFPSTMYVWQIHDGMYRRKATKMLFTRLAEQEGVDYKTVEGFRQILPFLTQKTFKKEPINEWKTTLGGMIDIYEDSPSQPVLELIENDQEFLAIRQVGIKGYDFPDAPKHTWITKDGVPTTTARAAVKQLISCLGEHERTDYRTVNGFQKILPRLTVDSFKHVPINVWGTTLVGMLSNAYNDSPSAAVLDLLEHDDEFTEIKKVGLHPYDFPQAPQNTWVDTNGIPTNVARAATKKLIEALAKSKGIPYQTFTGFKQILPMLTEETFKNSPINVWGTTLVGMLSDAYNDSPSAAVLDLICHDEEFAEVRTRNLQLYDFPSKPQNTWIDKQGLPTTAARKVTKILLEKKAREKRINYTTIEGFTSLLAQFDYKTFRTEPINEWGTTLSGMLDCAYNNSLPLALRDLVDNDDNFRVVRGKINALAISGGKK